MLQQDEIEYAVRCLKAVSHPTRLGILCLLRDGEKTVYELQSLLGSSQSNISQHLSVMRERSILTTRKEANQVYYAIANEELYRFLDVVRDVFCQSQRHLR